MKMCENFLKLASAALLAGCTATDGASDGAGYERQTPNSETRTFITIHDPLFRDQVAAHNEQCAKDPMCRK